MQDSRLGKYTVRVTVGWAACWVAVWGWLLAEIEFRNTLGNVCGMYKRTMSDNCSCGAWYVSLRTVGPNPRTSNGGMFGDSEERGMQYSIGLL